MSKYGFGEDQVKVIKGFPLSECVDNVSLESASYEKGEQKNGEPFEAIDFIYSRPDGGRLRDRMFDVNEDNIEPRGEKTLEETIKNEYVNFNTRLYEIAGAFGISRSELNEVCIGHDNFKSFADTYCKKINEESAGKTVYIKTVKKKGGFINAARFGFIQAGDGDCTLEWSDYEKKQNKKNSRPAAKTEAVSESTVVAEVEDDDDDWLDDV